MMKPKANYPKPEMDTGFCIHWKGDRKTKFCRQCAVEGSPCLELWRAVKVLAVRNLVMVNPKQGHRYQLEPPKKNQSICYLQTLQGKHAHFGLPIEDFLYVTKTGRGGMYETPSRTKQHPFVELILEQISSNTQIPDGAGIVKAVQAIPPKAATF
jgi:hypothetical protein